MDTAQLRHGRDNPIFAHINVLKKLNAGRDEKANEIDKTRLDVCEPAIYELVLEIQSIRTSLDHNQT